MKGINEVNNNINSDQILLKQKIKSCPYCNILLSLLEFEDHILCHEIDQNENRNLSNNINGFGITNNTNNNNNQNSKSESELEQESQKPFTFGNFFKRVEDFIESKKNNDENNEENNNNINNDRSNANNNIINNNANNNNNNSNSLLNIIKNKKDELNDKVQPLISKVKDFFDSRNSSNDSGDASSDSSGGPILNICFPRLFRRRRSNSDDSSNNNNSINTNSNNNIRHHEILLDDLLINENLNKEDSQTIMNYIPNSVIKEVKNNENKNNSKCLICLSDFQIGDNASTLPCLHIFHSNCLEKWINQQKWCPICKYDVSLNSLLSKNNEDF
jgi:hypothetical protein